MTNKSIRMDDALHDYLLRVSLREPPLWAQLREETARQPMARMQIAPEQGQFMSLLTRLLGVRRALEVGVFTGYSSLCLAAAMPEDGRLLACDTSEEWTAIARRYWQAAGLEARIELRLAPALDTMDALLAQGQAGTFDLVFIDADKENYDGYYERALALLRVGGVVLIDNVLWSGQVADAAVQDDDTRAIRALNAKIHADQRVEISLLPLADGLTLARKR